MKLPAALIALSVLGLGIACAEETALPQDPQALVDFRVGEMKAMGGALKALSQYDANAGPMADLADEAARVQATAAAIPSWFRVGTATGDPGVTKSRALPAIWTDWNAFAADAKALEDVGAALAAAVASNDAAALAAAVDRTGQACQTCHKAFRAPEEH